MLRSFMLATWIGMLVAMNMFPQPVHAMRLFTSESTSTQAGLGENFTTYLPMVRMTLQPLPLNDQISSTYHASIGHDDLPFLVFHDALGLQTSVAHCLNAQCSQLITTVLATTTKQWGSKVYTAIDNDGFGVVLLAQPQAAGNTALSLYRCTNRACTTSTRTLLDQGSTTYAISNLGLAISSQNIPIITYTRVTSVYDEATDIGRISMKINLINCQNQACTTRTSKTLKTLNSVQRSTRKDEYQNLSLIINQQSLSISYQYTAVDYQPSSSNPRNTLNQLYLIHCATYTCTQPRESLIASYTTTDALYIPGISSIIQGPTNKPLFTFNTNAGITLVDCSDEQCQNTTSSVLQSETGYISILMNQQHNFFSYKYPIYDGRNINFTFCETIACEPTLPRINTTDPMFVYEMMLFNSHGYPVIIHWNPYIKNIYVFNCASMTCTTP